MEMQIALAVGGLLVHILKKGTELRGQGFSLVNYVRNNPYQSMLSPIGGAILFGFFQEFDLMNPATAFAAGYMGNSVADIIGERVSL